MSLAHKISERRLCLVKPSLFNYGCMYLCASPSPVSSILINICHSIIPLRERVREKLTEMLFLMLLYVSHNNKYSYYWIAV